MRSVIGRPHRNCSLRWIWPGVPSTGGFRIDDRSVERSCKAAASGTKDSTADGSTRLELVYPDRGVDHHVLVVGVARQKLENALENSVARCFCQNRLAVRSSGALMAWSNSP